MDCLSAQGNPASLLTLLHVKMKKSGRSSQQEPIVIRSFDKYGQAARAGAREPSDRCKCTNDAYVCCAMQQVAGFKLLSLRVYIYVCFRTAMMHVISGDRPAVMQVVSEDVRHRDEVLANP